MAAQLLPKWEHKLECPMLRILLHRYGLCYTLLGNRPRDSAPTEAVRDMTALWRRSEVIHNIPMDCPDETDNCGGAGSDECTPDTANPLTWRIGDIPGLPPAPSADPKIQAAYWFAVTLTDGYGWKLFEVGTDVAAGGFIADIPGETMAIYRRRCPMIVPSPRRWRVCLAP